MLHLEKILPVLKVQRIEDRVKEILHDKKYEFVDVTKRCCRYVNKQYIDFVSALNYVNVEEPAPLQVADGPVVMYLTKKDRWLLKNVNFVEKAIWARPLSGQWHMELNRALIDILTLGFFEFSRCTAGNAYHWAFVTRGRLPEGLIQGWREHPYVYVIVQDRRVGENKEWKKHKRHMSRFTVHSARTPQEAALKIGCTRRNGFVKYPEQAYGKNPRLDLRRAWRKNKKSRSFDDLIDLIKICPSTRKKYSLTSNNCQHFASYMFHDVGDKGRRVKMSKKKPNLACV